MHWYRRGNEEHPRELMLNQQIYHHGITCDYHLTTNCRKQLLFYFIYLLFVVEKLKNKQILVPQAPPFQPHSNAPSPTLDRFDVLGPQRGPVQPLVHGRQHAHVEFQSKVAMGKRHASTTFQRVTRQPARFHMHMSYAMISVDEEATVWHVAGSCNGAVAAVGTTAR